MTSHKLADGAVLENGRIGCACAGCQDACRHPGALLPSQLPDYKPADLQYGPYGEARPKLRKRMCKFFHEGRCLVHDFKPFECREYTHNDSMATIAARTAYIASVWSDYQRNIDDMVRDYNADYPESE